MTRSDDIGRYGRGAVAAAGRGAVLASSMTLVSCSPPPRDVAPGWREADAATWQAVRRAFDVEKASRPDVPWAGGVRISFHEPRAHEVDGRGAIAVAPGKAVRMILVGAAGFTLLDAWVTPTEWRIAVPPADVVRRGTDVEPDDLPVGFLRWCFFRPLAGTLFGGRVRPSPVFFLRDGEAVLEVHREACDHGELTRTTRRLRGRTERIDECREPGSPRVGDWVHYEDESSGLKMELAIESVAHASPDEAAFHDPEAVP